MSLVTGFYINLNRKKIIQNILKKVKKKQNNPSSHTENRKNKRLKLNLH